MQHSYHGIVVLAMLKRHSTALILVLDAHGPRLQHRVREFVQGGPEQWPLGTLEPVP
jgi:hypothetical protein